MLAYLAADMFTRQMTLTLIIRLIVPTATTAYDKKTNSLFIVTDRMEIAFSYNWINAWTKISTDFPVSTQEFLLRGDITFVREIH